MDENSGWYRMRSHFLRCHLCMYFAHKVYSYGADVAICVGIILEERVGGREKVTVMEVRMMEMRKRMEAGAWRKGVERRKTRRQHISNLTFLKHSLTTHTEMTHTIVKYTETHNTHFIRYALTIHTHHTLAFLPHTTQSHYIRTYSLHMHTHVPHFHHSDTLTQHSKS